MKKCIVCGKLIAKKTHTFYVRAPQEAQPAMKWGIGETMLAREARPEGFVDRSSSFMTTVYTAHPPQSREDCSRFTNHKVVRYRCGPPGTGIVEFSVWDGESYRDPHFHSETCAAAQGRASAHDGHRYRWE